MAKKSTASAQNLLDAIRPAEADGPLHSAIFSTYGLSLDQPNFFEHDFLPTLLGIGGVRDRGYLAPVTLERKLAEVYCALICDAHALAEGARPLSLRVDVIPIARPRHHAKIVLIHRHRLIRVVISSANLTDSGYRHQREASAVLDFRPDGGLPPSIFTDFVRGWLESLGEYATVPIRAALNNAVTVAESWQTRPVKSPLPRIQFVFGGGPTPIWQQVVDAWPSGEPVLNWRVCSPFWPGPDSKTTPFESIAAALLQRGASLEKTEIELICMADVPGDNARPVFPFPLLRGLRERQFPVNRGRIVPARLETLDNEVPDRKAEGHRALHAKWIVLRGPQTAVALLGSANFTNTGFGIATGANIEAGVLITCPTAILQEDVWRPPLVEAGTVDWATCASNDLFLPLAEPDDPVDWPAHLLRVDLDIDWTNSHAPSGRLLLMFVSYQFVPTLVLSKGDGTESALSEIMRIEVFPIETSGAVSISIDSSMVRRLLVSRAVQIRWGESMKLAEFPINVLDSAKAGLPSFLVARPDEQQLLAYFHGRIGEDDLLILLNNKAKQLEQGFASGADDSPPVDLQNYLIREFVESLFGLSATLRSAIYSHRALEITLLGEFSLIALADQVHIALKEGRRSPTAAAFQLSELLQVVVALPLESSEDDHKTLVNVQNRALERLLGLVSLAATMPSFAAVLRDPHFVSYVRASLPREIAAKFISIPGEHQSSFEEAAYDTAT